MCSNGCRERESEGEGEKREERRERRESGGGTEKEHKYTQTSGAVTSSSCHAVLCPGCTQVERRSCVHVWSAAKQKATSNKNLLSHIHFQLNCFSFFL